jgi:hypothetical protein
LRARLRCGTSARWLRLRFGQGETNDEADNRTYRAALYDWRICSNYSTEGGKKAAGSAQAASADGLQAVGTVKGTNLWAG